MSTTTVFILLVIGLAAACLGCWSVKWSVVARLRPRLVTIYGAAFLLSALTLLPWIHFQGPDHFDQQIAYLWQDPTLHRIVEIVPPLQDVVAKMGTSQGYDAVRLFPTEELQNVAALVRTRPQVTGLVLWRDVPGVSGVLRDVLAAMFILSVVVLVWSALAWAIPMTDAARVGAIAYGGLAGLALFSVLWYVPTVDSFGVRDDLLLRLIAFLGGARTGCGLFWSLLGLCLFVVGAGLDVFLTGEMEAVTLLDPPDDVETGW